MASEPYPNSAGSAVPRDPVPADACDAHIHVFDARFEEAPGEKLTATPAHATAADYRAIQRRLGTRRAVVVQPRAYGTDNSATLDAIAQLGASDTRGIAVLTPGASDAELRRLHAGGIRGLRLTLHAAAGAPTRFDMLMPLAERIAPLGWHLQLHFQAAQIVAHAAVLRQVPCPIVFDHLARLPVGGKHAEPAFALVRELLEQERAWVKLSGAYLNTHSGAHGYADTVETARALVRIAPDRLVWGSDWPHATEEIHKPDDAELMDLLGVWVPDAATRNAILVHNPARLYGFA
ncbi:putative metal-dependent hydrolase of the TIM-barrel fold protein [Variovorax sp. PBS-H4]|uniref:amidohydrolase family protein n=1 Tax=Variovorax sp. PBS-H4 TaxID=434008 RepID=UPI0013198381|nr:amidohydrolase family protein [Variovorax sp. PBS-H4]VTU28966.1 putative metal-dependent hydrolase of the TIM-barrel fold protein [Variovorax sp. PBS-H4]